MITGEIHIENDQGKKAVLAHNIITTLGRDSIVDAITSGTGPAWGYIGIGADATSPASANAALGTEIYREALSSAWAPGPGTARLLVVVGPYVGNGDWREVGIFDSDEKRVELSTAESTTNWTSDGALSQETSVVHQGQASIRCQMTADGTVPFTNSSLTPAYGALSFGTADYVQFWYRNSVDPGQLTIRVGTDPSNFYYWQWSPSAQNEFELVHLLFDDAIPTGSPSRATIAFFYIVHNAVGSTLDEYLDHVSLFGTAGAMMTRGTVSLTKAYNSVRNVYYTVKIN